jgi:hypothetical protein
MTRSTKCRKANRGQGEEQLGVCRSGYLVKRDNSPLRGCRVRTSLLQDERSAMYLLDDMQNYLIILS